MQVPCRMPTRDGPGRDFRARPYTELVANTFDVALCGAFGDKELVGDLAVRHAGGDKPDDLLLSTTERTGGDILFRLAGV